MHNQIRKNISFPNAKNENWRYFNLQDLKIKLEEKQAYDISQSIFYNHKMDTHFMINNKGIFINQKLPNGITIDIINPQDLKLLDDKIKNKIGEIAKIDNDYFVSENTQSFSQLILIKIKKNISVEPDLTLDVKISKNIKFKPRFFIYSEEKSSSSIQINWNNNFCNINSVFEVYLSYKAQLNLIIANNGKDSIDILNYSFQLEKESNLKTTFISLGRQILKNDIRINLIDQGAIADIGGLYIGNSNSIIDYNIKMNHLSKKTLSKQFFKGILM